MSTTASRDPVSTVTVSLRIPPVWCDGGGTVTGPAEPPRQFAPPHGSA